MSYIDMIGKTEEEAIAKALAQLGMDRDDVSVTILERAKSGFLGFGSSPARVRVTYGPDEADFEEPAPIVVTKPARKEEAPKVKPEAKRSEAKSKPEPKAKPERKAEPKPERKPQPKTEVKREEVKAAPVEDLAPANRDDAAAERIRSFLSGLLQHMDSPAEVKVYEVEKGRYKVILEGDKLGQLIGRRGETLDAIQQLTSYAVNDKGAGRVRVQVDAENYRAKREASLESLANKVAAKVTKYRRSVTLEPMNAYERHVIHAALQEVAGVTTYSIGSEPNRRVVVAYDRESR